jgi:hypothetical protein
MEHMTAKTWHRCTANWNNNDDKDFWIIRHEDQTELARLPATMNEVAVMAIVHAVRNLETATFDAGREFGSQAMMAAGRQKLGELTSTIKELVNHNTGLANKLEQLIGAKD